MRKVCFVCCCRNLSAGKMFQPLFSRAESHCKDENIQQQVYEKLQQESLTSALNQQRVSNAGVNKVSSFTTNYFVCAPITLCKFLELGSLMFPSE